MFITGFKNSILMVAVVLGGLACSPRVNASPRADALSLCTLVPAGATESNPTSTSAPTTSSSLPAAELRASDPVGPFPLSAIVPFPWTTIEGIWTMKFPDGSPLHFSFEVQTACDGRKVVQVTGFDQKSYRTMAEGVGLGLANDTMVRAVMTSATSQYMVFIRQFRLPAEKPATAGGFAKATRKISTVVTIRPFSGNGGDDVHMIARKASTLTLSEYVAKQQQDRTRREAEIRKRMSAGRP